MIRLILLYLQATSLTLEFATPEGRVFQFSGKDGIRGLWERFIRPDQHPTRTALGVSQAEEAWQAAMEPLVLYRVRKDTADSERLTREQILDRFEEMFPRSVSRR